jgi:hypothetical protein
MQMKITAEDGLHLSCKFKAKRNILRLIWKSPKVDSPECISLIWAIKQYIMFDGKYKLSFVKETVSLGKLIY